MTPPNKQNRTSYRQEWDGDIQELTCIGNGVSGIVFAIDEQKVAKIALGTTRSSEDIETERKVYRRLKQRRKKAKCQYILKCYEADNPRGIVLERCKESVRSRIRSSLPLSSEQKIRLAREATEGFAYLHDGGIVQGDVGCHNMLLDWRDTLKLGDFAGSSIDGSDTSVTYELRSRLPGIKKPSKKSDIFALGSAMYELATGHPPYDGESYRNVQNFFRKKIFPTDVEMIPELGPIIMKCWLQHYETAWDVLRALNNVESRPRPIDHGQKPLVIIDLAIAVSGTPKITPLALSTRSTKRDRAGPKKYVHHSSQHRAKYRRDQNVEKVDETQESSWKQYHNSGFGWFNRFMPWTQLTPTPDENPYS